jgi:predicted metalloprotease with PDZ domain
VIRPAWFLLMGEGVFGYPQGSDERRALFRWGRFPKGWRVASDLDHLAGERPGSVYDVVESVSIGGTDLTVEERVLGGKRARIAARGSWPFELGEFSARMAGIMEAQNRYWRDPGRPFLVVVAPLAGGTPNETFSHGTGRSDAFAFASSTNQPLKDMARVLAHESMHTWLARELGGPLPKDEALGYWFSEGFNDYLAARLLLRGGDWALEDYVAELNRVVRRYTLSPARSAPDRLVLEKFWSDSSYGQLPYDRGHLLALLIDYRMRGAGGGRTLDDVLLAQKQRAQAQSEGGGPTPAPLLFPLMMREVGGLDVSGLLDRHLNLGEPIALPDDLFGECGRFEAMREPMFDFGFDAQASRAAGNVVRGVDPAGPAYAAGLRDGMRLARIESASRETGEIVFLLAGEPEQRIRYVRRKSGENVFPRFVLSDVASVEKRERCRVRMAGV